MREFLKPAFFSFISFFSPAVATAQDINWLNSYEAGTYRYIDRTVAPLFSRLKQVESAWATTVNHRRQGANHDHIDAVERQLCYLAIQAINFQRSNDASRRQGSSRTLVAPSSVKGYLEAARGILSVARSYPTLRHCDELNWNERVRFLEAIREARDERSKLANLTNTRSTGQYAWSNTFSVELTPLPLKLEFLEGSLKLKLSSGLGPLKFDFQTGPKRVGTSSYNGLEYLRIVGPDGSMRVFDVRGQNFTFPTGLGEVAVNGATLTYICDSACTAFYETLNN